MLISRRVFLAGIAGAAVVPARALGGALIITGDMGVVGSRIKAALLGYTQWSGIDIKRGQGEDLATSEELYARFRGSSAVLHLAWDIKRYNTVEGMEYNLMITQKALEAAIDAGAAKFILASSAWAEPDLYGRRTKIIPEIYRLSKQRAEQLLWSYESRIKVSAIRFGQVNPKREDQTRDPDFDERVLMTDTDLSGLVDLGLRTEGVIGPFDARR